MKQTPTVVKDINQAELTEILLGIKGAKFATLVTESEPAMRHKNNPYEGVIKHSTTNVTLNYNHQNSSRKAGITSAPQARKWGNRMGSSPIIVSKGQMYLHGKSNAHSSKVAYFLGETQLNIDQVKELNTFLQHKTPQAVPVVNYKLDNIKEIKINKAHLTIK